MYHQPVGFQFALNQKKPWDYLLPDLQPFCEPSRQSSSALAVFKSKTAVSSGFGPQNISVKQTFFTFHLRDDSRQGFPAWLDMVVVSSWVPGCKAAGSRSLGPVATNLEATAGISNQNCPELFGYVCVSVSENGRLTSPKYPKIAI